MKQQQVIDAFRAYAAELRPCLRPTESLNPYAFRLMYERLTGRMMPFGPEDEAAFTEAFAAATKPPAEPVNHLLMAAMRGHGWGDPLHLEAHPNCTMCHAIRLAVGERTRERVLELAKWNSDHILELATRGGDSRWTGEDGMQEWQEVERFLGIAEGDPYCAELRWAGEYEGIDMDILDACSNA